MIINNNPLEEYCTDLAKFDKKYSKAEQIALWKDAQNGNITARNCLLESILKIIFKVATKFATPAIPFEDILSEANLCALECFHKFNPNCNVAFQTFILTCVSNRLKDNIWKNGHNGIYIPDHTRKQIRKLKSDRLNVDDKIRQKVIGAAATFSPTHYQAIEDFDIENRKSYKKQAHNAIKHLLITLLTPQERKVVRLRNGLTPLGNLKFYQIAQTLSITEKEVKVLYNRSVKKLSRKSRCQYCRKVFSAKWGGDERKQLYCSKKCKNRGDYVKRKWHNKKIEFYNAKGQTIATIKIDCEKCHHQFQISAQARNKTVCDNCRKLPCLQCLQKFIPAKVNAKFCSRECVINFQKSNHKPLVRHKKKCENCNCDISSVEKTIRFCSRRCAMLFRGRKKRQANGQK